MSDTAICSFITGETLFLSENLDCLKLLMTNCFTPEFLSVIYLTNKRDGISQDGTAHQGNLFLKTLR